MGVAVPGAVEELFKLHILVRRGEPALVELGPQVRTDLVMVVRADPGKALA